MSFAFSRSYSLFRIAAVGLVSGLSTACSLNATRLAGLTPPQSIADGSGQTQTATAFPGAVQRTNLTPLPSVPPTQMSPVAPVAGGPTPQPGQTPQPARTPVQPPPTSQPSQVAQAAPARAEGPHVVAAGETLYSLARRYQVSPARIAEANQLAATAHVRIGQKLTIPGVNIARMTEAVKAQAPDEENASGEAATPASEVVAETDDKAAEPASQPATKPTETPVEVAAQPAKVAEPTVQQMAYAPTDKTTEPARMSSTSFRWPVRGRIISEFGTAGSGQRNDGINLAVPEGSPVKAAENGVVVYAGNELKGYGNLVLVRHEGDFVTAYAHTSELLVKRGETVRRGQIIAKVGQTGSVNAPQLHFEIRKGPKPVNPADYLSGV